MRITESENALTMHQIGTVKLSKWFEGTKILWVETDGNGNSVRQYYDLLVDGEDECLELGTMKELNEYIKDLKHHFAHPEE